MTGYHTIHNITVIQRPREDLVKSIIIKLEAPYRDSLDGSRALDESRQDMKDYHQPIYTS